jgi:glycosyltransferase involved in cell wall biosynthesis
MTKLIIQIPCLNEAQTLPVTLSDIPSSIRGVDEIEILVIDDGSSDQTAETAREYGVRHIIRHKRKKGLARTFMAGLDASLRLGADIIVNTDGDNQYSGADIPKLVRPILEGNADIVIGNRNIDGIGHFSWIKKKLQRLGSAMVRVLSGTDVADATSGFRAFSREAALRINVISSYTYTIETIIQAGQKQLTIETVDIETNEKLRESRLMRGATDYISRSIVTMIRVFTLYRPLRVFTWLGGAVFFTGVMIGLRYLYLQFFGDGAAEHLASLILSAVLMITGFNFFVIAFLADLIASNRYLIENILSRLKEHDLKNTE